MSMMLIVDVYNVDVYNVDVYDVDVYDVDVYDVDVYDADVYDADVYDVYNVDVYDVNVYVNVYNVNHNDFDVEHFFQYRSSTKIAINSFGIRNCCRKIFSMFGQPCPMSISKSFWISNYGGATYHRVGINPVMKVNICHIFRQSWIGLLCTLNLIQKLYASKKCTQHQPNIY